MAVTVSKPPLIRRFVALTASTCLLLGGGACAAQAKTAGILPPRNPTSNCRLGNAFGRGALAAINACRADEHVGPLRFPSNWGLLTTVQQGFVLMDLERVNRGLPPVVGMTQVLNQLAAEGANNNTDPSFPGGGFSSGGAIWAGAPSVLAADYMWMYDDGPGSGNLACTSVSAAGCWGHRDIILWNRSHGALVGGGGASVGGGVGSYAYMLLTGYAGARLDFTWAGELKYFAATPGPEPLDARASQITRHRQTHKKSRNHRKTSPKRHRRHPTRKNPGGLTITFG